MNVDRLNLIIGIVSIVIGLLVLYKSGFFFQWSADSSYPVGWYFSALLVFFGGERIYRALK